MGEVWEAGTCKGAATLYTFGQTANLPTTLKTFAGNSDWRVPDIQELVSIIEFGTEPALNGSVFPEYLFGLDSFWSSSVSKYSTGRAWTANFYGGGAFSVPDQELHKIRLVRGVPGPVGSILPLVALNPGALNFISQNLASTSASQAITLSNTGKGMLNITSIVASGDYASTSDCGTSLAPGASCNIRVTFTPKVTGIRNGSLIISNNANGSPHGVNLTGTGVLVSPPVCYLTANPAFTITSGSSATLAANCSPTASSYVWTGGTCAGTSAVSCTVTPSATTTFTVAGKNAGGTGAPSSATITVLPPKPVCALTLSPASIAPGGRATLTASCSPTASSYVWTGGTCAGTIAATCTVAPSVSTTYGVAGINSGGTGAVFSATITVTTPSPARDPYCGYGQWQTNPTRIGEGQCLSYGDGVQPKTLEEINSRTDCGGFYKTYGMYSGTSLVAVYVSNGNCRAAQPDFPYAPPEPIAAHCIKYGGTGNYRWMYSSTVQPFGGYGTLGVVCEMPVAQPTTAPACTLSATPVVVSAGSSSTLTATCSPAATSYSWTGGNVMLDTSTSTESCEGVTTATCTVTPRKPTPYTVTGINAAGTGNSASAAVYVCNTPPSADYPPLPVIGTLANDQLRSGIEADTIDGGPGFDTVIYQCNKSSFTITKTTAGWIVSSQAEGIDTLTNVERIQFGDRTLALDISGNAGQAYRLYQAAFNRVPDNGGLKYWISTMDGGATLLQVAAGFMESAEYKALYGANPTNEDFVTKLYTNILHRAPDAGGYAYWVNALNTMLITQAQALVFLSESTENQAGVINAIINGIDLLN
jgi:hypothetical protein